MQASRRPPRGGREIGIVLAPGFDEAALLIEFEDAVCADVGDVDEGVASGGDAEGADELPRSRAPTSEREEVVPVEIEIGCLGTLVNPVIAEPC